MNTGYKGDSDKKKSDYPLKLHRLNRKGYRRREVRATKRRRGIINNRGMTGANRHRHGGPSQGKNKRSQVGRFGTGIWWGKENGQRLPLEVIGRKPTFLKERQLLGGKKAREAEGLIDVGGQIHKREKGTDQPKKERR